MLMIFKSKQHLKAVNESYTEHFLIAAKIGLIMIVYGLMAILHAIIPAYFQTSVSNKIKELNLIVTKR